MRQYSDLAIDLVIDKMAEIFNKKSTPLKTSSVLLQAIEIIRQLRREAAPPPNPPLTLEELREMDGAPVWVEPVEGGPHWRMVDARCGRLLHLRENPVFLEECGKTWLAYRRKPEEGKNARNNQI